MVHGGELRTLGIMCWVDLNDRGSVGGQVPDASPVSALNGGVTTRSVGSEPLPPCL
jgi:hypothetical protein